MHKRKTSTIVAAVILASAPVATLAADDIAYSPASDPAWYARAELGAAWLGESRGYWWGPDGPPSAPRITFDLDNPLGFSGSVAVGRDFVPGVRGDLSFGYTGKHSVDAQWLSASNGDPGPHADIEASVYALTGMANIFLEPLAMSGHDGPFQPFVTAGIGAAVTHMDEWTRYNPLETHPVRTWSAGSNVNFAWTVGAGVSADASSLMNRPAFVDVAYRYSDFGKVEGGTDPVFPTPPPTNSPTEAFNFHYRTHAVTVGLRIPFNP